MGFARKQPPEHEQYAPGGRPLRPKAIPVSAALEINPAPDNNSAMSTPVTREELDAKLLTNVAEVKAVAHEMRADIGGLRADNQAQFSILQSLFTALNTKIDGVEKVLEAKMTAMEGRLGGRIDGLEGKIVGLEGKIIGVEGKLDGQRTALVTSQWVVGLAIGLATLWITYLQSRAPTAPPAIISAPPHTPAQTRN